MGFSGDSLVLMDGGQFKRIDRVIEGDKVISINNEVKTVLEKTSNNSNISLVKTSLFPTTNMDIDKIGRASCRERV